MKNKVVRFADKLKEDNINLSNLDSPPFQS